MIQLRDGSTAEDPRLDRLPTWDDRNLQYHVREILKPETYAKPRGYTWRVPFRYNQGMEGRCVEYGIVHELGARPVTVQEKRLQEVLAGKEIYWPAQQQDEWPGGSYPGADPVYEGTSVLAGVKVAASLGFYSEYRWATEIDDLVAAIGYKGPAILGINWYTSMFNPDDRGFISISGSIAGGHCVCFRGVNVHEQYFEGIQSWGGWGIDDKDGPGVFRVRYEDMARLMSEDAEVCIPVHRTKE